MRQSPLSTLALLQTAAVFRHQPPQEDPQGNVRALAIRDLVGSRPLRWHDLPRVKVPDKYLSQCLDQGDVLIPSRGDYYRAWLFEGADEPVFPVGQLNIVKPGSGLDARYLVWYLNQSPTQAAIATLLTGTSIKSLTKAALLTLEIKVPSESTQQLIAELDHTTKRIASIRHRLSEIDRDEIALVTRQLLRRGGVNA